MATIETAMTMPIIAPIDNPCLDGGVGIPVVVVVDGVDVTVGKLPVVVTGGIEDVTSVCKVVVTVLVLVGGIEDVVSVCNVVAVGVIVPAVDVVEVGKRCKAAAMLCNEIAKTTSEQTVVFPIT
jgi:hypothetical protein